MLSLPPVVDQVDISSVITGLAGPLHRHPLKIRSEITLKHPAIGLVTSRVLTPATRRDKPFSAAISSQASSRRSKSCAAVGPGRTAPNFR